ncbi:MAG: PhzF family phenazine biosynthesis protein, partial [Chthoniobacterales bacterium]
PQLAGALRKLRIFTPSAEIPFAGHPTIGAAQLLVELGVAARDENGVANFAFEEKVGLVPITVNTATGGAFFTWLTAPRLPEAKPSELSREALAALLGLDPEEILDDVRDAPCGYSAGVPFLFVPLRDRAALARATLDLALWREMIAETWAEDVYLFCHEAEGGGVHVRSRMFAPAMGIMVDPATGSAAAAFAGYLWKRNGGPGQWIIAQGVEMGRPSTLYVEAAGTDGRLQTVRVGGGAVRVSRGTMTL